MNHQHHSPAGKYDRAFATGVVLNIGFVIIEAVFGIISGSLALLADAGHNLSDVVGLLLAWGASYLSRRKPSERRTYGWHGSSILAAMLNAVILLLAVGAIAWEAVKRLAHPAPVAGKTVIAVAVIGMIINTSHGAAIQVRAQKRSQYPRRFSAHGGRCRCFGRCRRGRRGHFIKRLAVA